MKQFVCETPLDKNGLLVLEKKDFHYLRNVLRLSVGDMINVRIENPSEKISGANMTICKIDDARKKIVLQKCAEISSETAAENFGEKNSCALNAKYFLFQFLPKPQKLELIVRQATECGVSFVVPIVGEYTQGGCEKTLQNVARYERIIREARQQSGSAVETKILPAQSLDAALEFWRRETCGFSAQEKRALVLYERCENTTAFEKAIFANESDSEKFDLKKIKACALAVGCEGGISPAEFARLLDAGFCGVHFNTNILRCETAALYGMAAVQSLIEN